MTLANIKIGDKLLWQHRLADEFKDEAQSPEQLQRITSVKAIIDNYIKTDFGDYFIHNGFNMDAPCGCNRFCNCYGKVSPLIDNT